MKVNKITLMIMGLALASLLASCKKDENNNGTVSGEGFKAMTEQDGNGRTYLDGVEVNWSTGDQIKVYNGAETRVFGLTEGENSTSGSFNTSNGQFYDYSGPFSAAYPSSQVTGMGDATASFSVPATQTFKSGSFGEGAMPMVAYSTDQTLAFKNLFGGLCFPLYGDNLTVKKVVLTTAADEALWGIFDVAISTSGGDPTLGAISNADATAKKSVTLDCGAGIQLGSTAASATEFYIMVPPGTLEAGFTVTAYNENDIAVFTKSTTTAPGTDFIQRNTVRKVNSSLQVVVNIENLAVTTVSPTFITMNSAKGIGAVSGGAFTACGVLYIKADDVLGTLAEQLKIGGTSVLQAEVATPSANFDVDLQNLESDKVYYVRAYAVDDYGIVNYGDDIIPFATRRDYYTGDNAGKMADSNGNIYQFSVSATTKVGFSMGNLQYQASSNTWRFAEYQYEYVGDATYGFVYEGGVKCNNALISQNYTGWIDLFGWGTSGYAHGASGYQPWTTSFSNGAYYAYGNSAYNLNNSTGQADWGYNAILNGGNVENYGWRTLQGYNKGGNVAEWNYLFNSRSCNYRYAQVQMLIRGTAADAISTINGFSSCGVTINGLVVFPDSFTWPSLVELLNRLNTSNSWTLNRLSEAQWSLLEKSGAIFLPVTGSRAGTNVSSPRELLYYWSATVYDQNSSYYINCQSSLDAQHHQGGRINGFGVRLVCDVN